jgi:hypothetical protein
MSEILSVAIYETLPGKEEESLATMAELGTVLAAREYSRDMLYRDERDAVQYVLLRYWKSEEARRSAQEDPDVQRCWAKLAHEIRIVKVYETLDEVGLR